jgi:hypothetical protein
MAKASLCTRSHAQGSSGKLRKISFNVGVPHTPPRLVSSPGALAEKQHGAHHVTETLGYILENCRVTPPHGTSHAWRSHTVCLVLLARDIKNASPSYTKTAANSGHRLHCMTATRIALVRYARGTRHAGKVHKGCWVYVWHGARWIVSSAGSARHLARLRPASLVDARSSPPRGRPTHGKQHELINDRLMAN